MSALDPTRMSCGDVLLSEFVGNHSVYYYGHANPIQIGSWKPNEFGRVANMLSEIRDCVDVNEGLQDVFSISYGYIHPILSEKIVKWKNPKAPSYHRWDMGAAFDINFHNYTFGPYHLAADVTDTLIEELPAVSLSPLGIAMDTNGALRPPTLDRTITYSESPWICFATCPEQYATGRGKWYENRFMGERGVKPRFMTWSDGQSRRTPSTPKVDWRGGGWPSHHGGGLRQYHHVRTSLFTVMSDWLYNRDKVHFGQANRMPSSQTRYDVVKNMMYHAGAAFDTLQASANYHLPITEGIVFENRISNWEEDGQWSFTVAASPSHGHRLYDQIMSAVVPANGEMLGITQVEELEDRAYISGNGKKRLAAPRQFQVRITGECDADRDAGRQFDFEAASCSPTFREGHAAGSIGCDTDPEGMALPNHGPRRRRAARDSRRGVRTRTRS